MTASRALRLPAAVLAIPLGVVASLGLIDALRAVSGPSLALALPLRETGHQDRGSFAVVAGVCALVFGLSALALNTSRGHSLRTALLPATGVLVCALALQAVSLQLVRQASLGLDWRAALASPAPYVCALGALAGITAANWAASSDRWTRSRLDERPVEGDRVPPPPARISS